MNWFLVAWVIQFVCFIGVVVLGWRAQSRLKYWCDRHHALKIETIKILARIAHAIRILEPTAEWDRPIPEGQGETGPYFRSVMDAQELIAILKGENGEEKK